VIGRQVRLLCPWARHLTGLLLPWVVTLVVTGGSLNRRPKRFLRCILVEAPWQINEFQNLTSAFGPFQAMEVRWNFTEAQQPGCIPKFKLTVKNNMSERLSHLNSNQSKSEKSCMWYSFICQGTSTRRKRKDLCRLLVKLPPVTTSLTTQR